MIAVGWRDEAACKDEDPEVFFPIGEPGSALYERDVAAARRVCRTCPVRDKCLAFAVDHKVVGGVFGGLTEDERGATVRARARAAVQ